MANIDNIELRSEKTRQIIGMVPSRIVRYGTLIISAIIIALLVAAYFIPYPDNLQVNAMVVNTEDGEQQIQAYVPYSYVSTIHEGMNANIEFDGYPSADYGYTTAIVTDIDKGVCSLDNQNYFTTYMYVDVNNSIIMLPKMNAQANILLSNKTLLQKILKL